MKNLSYQIGAGLILIFLFLLAGCGTNVTVEPPLIEVTPEIQLITTTEAPFPLEDMAEWDIVIIGDSTLWGIGDQLSTLIQTQMDIQTNLSDFSFGNMTAVGALDAVLHEKPNSYNSGMHGWPDVLREAEFVILHPSPAESESTSDPGDWSCMYPPYYVNNCSLESFSQFQADYRSIIDEIIRLRDGKPIIIRFGSYWGRPGNWGEEDIVHSCMTCLETYSKAIEQIANEYNIPFRTVLDVFNMPDHRSDPADMGYIGEDGVHASEVGQRIFAQSIFDLGFETLLDQP